MSLPFVDRPPTDAEVERIRLILSTYQDGTGMLQVKGGGTLPGWRDFERAVALALGGSAQESKAVFDVILSGAKPPNYGLSCKMRRELHRVGKDGRATIEVANAAGEFWDLIKTRGMSDVTYRDNCPAAGAALFDVVDGWHAAADHTKGGTIDLTKSFYLVLLWNKKGDYQLFQFALSQVDASKLAWSCPDTKGKQGRRLVGNDGTGNLVEWYGHSGGQLKVYPLAKTAIWSSPIFKLEPLPSNIQSVLAKAKAYFPKKWKDANP